MIALSCWVLVFVALGLAALRFGVDSRDVAYSARFAPRAAPPSTAGVAADAADAAGTGSAAYGDRR